MSGFLSKTLCLGIGAAFGAGITYLAMKDEPISISEDFDEISDVVEADDLMKDEVDAHLSADAGVDENPVLV